MAFIKRIPNVQSFGQLNLYLSDLEERIENSISVPEFGIVNFNEFTKEPSRLSKNDILVVDGTNYDPGEGAGLYRYDGNSLLKIG